MTQRIMRLMDAEDNPPLLCRRFFLFDDAGVASGAQKRKGSLVFWPTLEPYEAEAHLLEPLPPELEAAALHMEELCATPQGYHIESLSLIAYLYRNAVENANEELSRLVDQPQAGLYACLNLQSLLAERFVPLTDERTERITTLWNDVLIKAKNLTRAENEAFGLT